MDYSKVIVKLHFSKREKNNGGYTG